MIKTISITLHRRPEYTRRMLLRLSLCEALSEYKVCISVDAGSQEVVEMAKAFKPHLIKINNPKLGCDSNTFQALKMAFEDESSDFNIHLEDDTVPSKDCLLYFDWCRQKYEDDLSVFSIHAYNKFDTDRSNVVKRLQGFGCWGWACWRRTWDEVKDKWQHGGKGWDHRLYDICGKRDRIYPLLSRVQQIGEKDGVHVVPAIHRKEHFNEVWANQIVVKEFIDEGRGSWQGD